MVAVGFFFFFDVMIVSWSILHEIYCDFFLSLDKYLLLMIILYLWFWIIFLYKHSTYIL